jgi:hypothetical protein
MEISPRAKTTKISSLLNSTREALIGRPYCKLVNWSLWSEPVAEKDGTLQSSSSLVCLGSILCWLRVIVCCDYVLLCQHIHLKPTGHVLQDSDISQEEAACSAEPWQDIGVPWQAVCVLMCWSCNPLRTDEPSRWGRERAWRWGSVAVAWPWRCLANPSERSRRASQGSCTWRVALPGSDWLKRAGMREEREERGVFLWRGESRGWSGISGFAKEEWRGCNRASKSGL